MEEVIFNQVVQIKISSTNYFRTNSSIIKETVT